MTEEENNREMKDPLKDMLIDGISKDLSVVLRSYNSQADVHSERTLGELGIDASNFQKIGERLDKLLSPHNQLTYWQEISQEEDIERMRVGDLALRIYMKNHERDKRYDA